MNERLQGSLPSVTLFLLAVASGVAWRAELQLRSGWASLAWLEFFHWAVPVSVAAFIAWAACFAVVRRRLLFVAALIGFAGLGHTAAEVALRLFFIAGPSAGFAIASLGGGDFGAGVSRFEMLRWAAIVVWPLIPLSFCLLCHLFGAHITLSAVLSSAALFTISWPLAVFVRGFFEHHGSPDLIHALKSGFVIPFLVVSLGLPLLHLPSAVFHASPRTNVA